MNPESFEAPRPRLSRECVRLLLGAFAVNSIPLILALLWAVVAIINARINFLHITWPSLRGLMDRSMLGCAVLVYLGDCYIFWRVSLSSTLSRKERWLICSLNVFLILGLSSLLFCAVYFR